MAAIFKRIRNGNKRDAVYWIEFTDEIGKRRRKKGFSDRRLTEQYAAELEDQVRLKKSGLVDPLLESLANHRALPIGVHVDAYESHLGGGSRTKKHKTLTIGRVRRVLEGAKIKTLADLELSRVDRHLHSLHEGGMGARTLNHHVQALGGFCRWLMRDNRLAANPLQGLTTYNAEADVRHKRRALSIEEVASLIESARTSEERIQSYGPEERARLYEIGVLTGLRRKELASLTPGSFDLKSAQPTVTVAAACSKHRRTDVLPLHPQLVASLPQWLRGMKPPDHLFPGLAGKKTWLMVKKDLERVGIPYETEEGIADFHGGLRHTYITELLRNGASITEARQLARHSDVKMTMRYTHVGLADQARALAALPATTPARDAGQYIGRTARRRTGDDRSGQDDGSPRPFKADVDGTPSRKESSVRSWHNESGDDDACHHPLKSGGGGNRTRVPK